MTTDVINVDKTEIYDVFENTNTNFKTAIGRKYSLTDVKLVWEGLSQWIKQSLLQNKAVLIKDFGEFSISEWQLYVGLIRPVKQSQPVFILSQKLVDFFHLKRPLVYVSHKIPQQTLNYGIVAKMCKKNRIMVENCITEVIQALTRLLSEECDLKLEFPEVGELQVKNKKVSFKFSDDLLQNNDHHTRKSEDH